MKTYIKFKFWEDLTENIEIIEINNSLFIKIDTF